jgi:hypothetical protein
MSRKAAWVIASPDSRRGKMKEAHAGAAKRAEAVHAPYEFFEGL